MKHSDSDWSNPAANNTPYMGPRWLVEERDACGVGFIASPAGIATHKLIEQTLGALIMVWSGGRSSF